MKSLLIYFLAVTILASCNSKQDKNKASLSTTDAVVTTYYLIRHAEKDRSDPENENPNLTEQGIERAKGWAVYFANISLDQIYSTEYNRTQQTAMYVAAAQEITVQAYDPSNMYNEDFKKNTLGKTVLIVGHSNTTPQFVNAIIGDNKYTDIDDRDNGSLYIVRLEGDSTHVEIEHID